MAENAVNTEQGVILEALNYKADLDGNNLTGTGFEDYIKSLGAGGSDGFIQETFQDGNDWYIIYKDGRCIQGGFLEGKYSGYFASSNAVFVPLLLPLVANNYANFSIVKYGHIYQKAVSGSFLSYTALDNYDYYSTGNNGATFKLSDAQSYDQVGFYQYYDTSKPASDGYFENVTWQIHGLLHEYNYGLERS